MNRDELLERAFLIPDQRRLGELSLRPLSLGSLILIRILPIHIGIPGQDSIDRQEHCSRYLWAHSEPLHTVLEAVHSGSWEREWTDWQFQFEILDVWPELEQEIGLVEAMTEAAHIKIRSRPVKPGQGEEEADPSDILEPSWVASRAWALIETTGWSEEQAIWRTPLSRALQYYHVRARANQCWTVADSGGAEAEASEDTRKTFQELADHVASSSAPEFDEAGALDALDHL